MFWVASAYSCVGAPLVYLEGMFFHSFHMEQGLLAPPAMQHHWLLLNRSSHRLQKERS